MEPPSTPGWPGPGPGRGPGEGPRRQQPQPLTGATGDAAGEPAAVAPDPAVAEVLADVLALARTLEALDLHCVEPLLGPPRWS